MTLPLTAKAEDEDNDDDDESESVRTAGCVTLEPPLSAKIISPLSQLCHSVASPSNQGLDAMVVTLTLQTIA